MRSEERAAKLVPGAAGQHLGAVVGQVGHVPLDLVQALVVDQRAHLRPGVEAVADLDPLRPPAQQVGELLGDAALQQDAVGRGADLPRVAELRGDDPGDRLLQVRVVEDDERGVAAEFKRQLLYVGGGLPHQDLADLGRPGEAAKEALDQFAALSAPFGVTVEVRDGLGAVRL